MALAAIGALQQAALPRQRRRRLQVPRPTGQAPYNYEDDPIYQQIKGQSNATLQGQLALYGANRRQSMIDYGFDPSFDYGDEATKAAAMANPFSVLRNLSHSHELRAKNLDEGLNKSNLYYSGYRGQQLGEEQRQYLGEQSSAAGGLRAALAQIAQNELNARGLYDQTVGAAGQTAYGNALNFGLQNNAFGTAVQNALAQNARRDVKPKKKRR